MLYLKGARTPPRLVSEIAAPSKALGEVRGFPGGLLPLPRRGPGGPQPRAPRVGAPASPPRLARSWSRNSDRPGRAGAEPLSRLGRGAPLPFRPEPEEGPLRPAAVRKTKPKFPTTNSSRGSSCIIGFFAETTRSWRRKLGSNQIPRKQSAKLVKIYQIPFNYHSILVESMSHVNKACGPFFLHL